mmetsp:Transcript_19852/g.55357  ORF Transcript_19852/g.55357 Transcript_19852/m.55357 type:complete len:274 (-) Transcript_19852:733-1554(-)
MHFIIALLARPERALRQPGSLVALEVAPLLEGQGVKVHHLACCHLSRHATHGGRLLTHSSHALSLAQLPRLLPDIALHCVLPLLCTRACSAQLVQDAHSVRVAGHLRLDLLALSIILSAREPSAPHNLEPIAQQLLDQLKLLKAQRQHELILDRTRVGGRRKRGQHLLCELLRTRGIDGIAIGTADAALKPVGVDFLHSEAIVPLLLARVHVHVGAHLGPDVSFHLTFLLLVSLIFIHHHIALILLILILSVELHCNPNLSVHGVVGGRQVLL